MKLRLAITTLSLAVTLFTSASSRVHASFVAGALEPTQILNNVQLVASLAKQAISAASDLALKMKELSLDGVARMVAQGMLDQNVRQALNWVGVGFEGGAGIITNPDAFKKNIENQLIRKSLDEIKSVGGPFASSLAGKIIKDVRSDRGSIGQKFAPNLFATVQSETCNDANLTALAQGQLASELATNVATMTLAQKKSILRSTLCSNNPSAAAKETLNACFKSGACGGWKSLFSSVQPVNTDFGNKTLVSSALEKLREVKVTDERALVGTGGVLPNKECVDLKRNEEDGSEYCAEYQVTHSAQETTTRMTNALESGNEQLKNIKEITDMVTSFMSSIGGQLLAKGVRSFSQSSGSRGVNKDYDDLLQTNSGLPGNRQITIPDDQTTGLSDITNAPTIANQACTGAAVGSALSGICAHYTSNKEAQAVDQRFQNAVLSYKSDLNRLKTCSQEVFEISPGDSNASGWQRDVEEREQNQALIGAERSLSERMQLYPSSLQKLANLIANIVQDEKLAVSAFQVYASKMQSDTEYIALGQEKVSEDNLDNFTHLASQDRPRLLEKVSSCDNYLASLRPDTEIEPSPGDGP